LKLQEFQFALMKLHAVPREDISVWLDIFEFHWMHERVAASKEIVRLAQTKDAFTECEMRSMGAAAAKMTKMPSTSNVAYEDDDVLANLQAGVGSIQFVEEEYVEKIAMSWLRIILQLRAGEANVLWTQMKVRSVGNGVKGVVNRGEQGLKKQLENLRGQRVEMENERKKSRG